MESHTLTCPADGGRLPAVEGVEVVDGKWRLSVAAHEDLLRAITGVDRGELKLQELATITARLEGYVERGRRVTPASASAAGTASDETVTESGGSDPSTQLRRRLSPVRSGARSRTRDSDSEQQPSSERDDIERVHELSRFFRAALDGRRDAAAV